MLRQTYRYVLFFSSKKQYIQVNDSMFQKPKHDLFCCQRPAFLICKLSLPFIADIVFWLRASKSFVPWTVERINTSFENSLSTKRKTSCVGFTAALAKSYSVLSSRTSRHPPIGTVPISKTEKTVIKWIFVPQLLLIWQSDWLICCCLSIRQTNVSQNTFFRSRYEKKHFLWRQYCGKKPYSHMFQWFHCWRNT